MSNQKLVRSKMEIRLMFSAEVWMLHIDYLSFFSLFFLGFKQVKFFHKNKIKATIHYSKFKLRHIQIGWWNRPTHQSLPVVLEVWWEMCQYWVFPGLRLFRVLFHLPLQICLPTRGESLLWYEHAWSQKKGAR